MLGASLGCAPGSREEAPAGAVVAPSARRPTPIWTTEALPFTVQLSVAGTVSVRLSRRRTPRSTAPFVCARRTSSDAWKLSAFQAPIDPGGGQPMKVTLRMYHRREAKEEIDLE